MSAKPDIKAEEESTHLAASFLEFHEKVDVDDKKRMQEFFEFIDPSATPPYPYKKELFEQQFRNISKLLHPDRNRGSEEIVKPLFDFMKEIVDKIRNNQVLNNKEKMLLKKVKDAIKDVNLKQKLFDDKAALLKKNEFIKELRGLPQFVSAEAEGKAIFNNGHNFFVRPSLSEDGKYAVRINPKNTPEPLSFYVDVSAKGFSVTSIPDGSFRENFDTLKSLTNFLNKPTLVKKAGFGSDMAYDKGDKKNQYDDKGDKKGVNEREKPKSSVSEGKPLILALITLKIDVESLIKNNKLTEDSLLKLLIKKRNEMVTPKEDEALSLFFGKAKGKLIDPEKVAIVVELANKLYRGSQPDAKPAEKPGFAGEKPYVPPVSPHFDAKLGSDKKAKGEAIEITPEAAAKLVEGLVLLKIDITGLDEKILEKRLSDKMMYTSKRILAKEMEAGRQFFDKDGNIDKKKIAAAVKHVANILEKGQKFDQGFKRK